MSKPAVFFDMSILAHSVGGITRYLTSLYKAISELDENPDVIFKTIDVPAVHPGVKTITAGTILQDPLYLKIPFLRRIPLEYDWELKSRRKRLTSLLPDCRVYHTSGVQPIYPEGSFPVVTVYDLSAIEHPEWHTPETVRFADAEMKLIEDGAAVVTISQWTANRLIENMGSVIERDCICVAGGAADDFFSPGRANREILAKYSLREGLYLLHVGNFVPRKHIPFLIDVHSSACNNALDIPLVLVGAGKWGDLKPDGTNVVILENIPDDDLLNLYRGARALLFPSECEGLGLPALEAMACGTPVIVSDAGALPETIGNDGVILPVGDKNRWVEEILHISDENYLNTLKDKVLKHKRPKWSDVAKRVCNFYGTVTLNSHRYRDT